MSGTTADERSETTADERSETTADERSETTADECSETTADEHSETTAEERSETTAEERSETTADDDRCKVAIACQGGGSHTAFTAGVLAELLSDWEETRYELVGISGTSGGAFNALAVWYGLVTADASRAVELLEALWDDLSATAPVDRWVNDLAVWNSQVEVSGFPTPRLSPYVVPGAAWGQDRIERTLTRHIDFDAIPELCRDDHPELVVGTVDVNGGVFETFTNADVTPQAVLASAAVPDLFPGVELHGHLHWDGLFSQNPPINDLMTVDPARKPDELWIIQVNPQTRDGVPTSLEEIADRRNELSGNLSLNQELRFIEWVNDWIDAGYLPADRFSRTTVRRIALDRAFSCSTKLDRRPSFVDELRSLGRQRGAAFRESLADGTVDDDAAVAAAHTSGDDDATDH
jgi:NTE family protein